MRRLKGLFSLWIITTFIISLTVTTQPASGNPGTVLSAQIVADETMEVDSTFHIDISVADVDKLLGYQYNLTYDTNVLTATGVSSYSPFVTPIGPPGGYIINDAAGYIAASFLTHFGDLTGFSTVDPAPITRIDFVVDAEGESILDLYETPPYETLLSNIYGYAIPHEVVDGYFSSVPLPSHDIAVTDVVLSVTAPTTVSPGEIININVTVLNQGSSTETFDVTLYRNETAIEAKPVTSLPSLTFEKVSYNWNTAGLGVGVFYRIKAVAETVNGETDTADNEFVDGDVYLGTRDVAILALEADNVTKPDPLLVNVTVKNEGDFTETFDVTAYYDSKEIDTQTVTLTAGVEKNLTFTLDTTGIAVDDYELKAHASTVPGEKDTQDNDTVKIGLTVVVHIGLPPGNPEAKFTVSPTTPIVGETVTFDASASTDEDGYIIKYAWNFGDGTTAVYVGANLTDTTTHAYNAPGTYDVTLTVTDNASLTDTIKHTVTISVHDIAVIAITAQPTQVAVGESVTITVTVENQGNFTEYPDISVYYDSNLIETKANTKILHHTSPTQVNFVWDTTGVPEGSHSIRADATQVQDETDTADNTMTKDALVSVIWPHPPVASFTYSPETPMIGETVTFDASLSTPNGGTIVSYAWDFDDGTTVVYVEGVNLTDTTTHAYDTRGTYTVNLTVTDSEGLSHSTTKDITVKAHDIAVTSIVVSSTKVTIGEPIDISVTVENQGDFPETFEVKVYYDDTEINTQPVPNLAAGASTTLTFTWNTTNVDADEYRIKATAILAGDADTTDNEMLSDIVTVEAPSELNILLYVGVGLGIVIIVAAVVYIWKIRTPT